MKGIFPTQEIGSLPKFGWRVKPFSSRPLDESDIQSAKRWGERLGVERVSELVTILSKKQGFSHDERKRIVEFSLLYAMAMQESAGRELGVSPGLDLIWSGEQARTEMYQTPVSSISGFSFIGRVRSFDNKYWRIASIMSRPGYRQNYHIEEFLFSKKHAKRKLKVPVTDSITIVAWSDNNYYVRRWSKKNLPPSDSSFSARREFVLDLAGVIRRVIRGLIEEGAEEVQLDIPAATQYQTVDDVKLVSEAFNETTAGLNAKFSVHSCYPPRYGYGLLFPYILEMKKCRRFSFEYANRDSFGRGITANERPGFEDLKLFREHGFRGELGVGVIHVHTDRLPSLETVRDRVLYAAKVTDLDPSKIYVNPDCGLRTRSPEVAYSMLGLVVAGAEKARRALR